MQLVIGNKNYSSWSMRPHVLMRQLDIPFEEKKLSFNLGMTSGGFAAALAGLTPTGRVPVLVDGDFAVWDSLAIVEYLHEKFPGRGVWPAAALARARARSICAEIHAGFGALRNACPMNIELSMPEIGPKVMQDAAVRRDVARIESMWAEALEASGGPFLFGAFGAADAFYAPVAMRFRSYAVPVGATTRAYIERLVATTSVSAWIRDALEEREYVAEDEPYRPHR